MTDNKCEKKKIMTLTEVIQKDGSHTSGPMKKDIRLLHWENLCFVLALAVFLYLFCSQEFFNCLLFFFVLKKRFIFYLHLNEADKRSLFFSIAFPKI